MNYEIKLSGEELDKVMMTDIKHWSSPVLTLNAYMQNGKRLYLLTAITPVIKLQTKVVFLTIHESFETAFDRAVMAIENKLNSLKWKKRA